MFDYLIKPLHREPTYWLPAHYQSGYKLGYAWRTHEVGKKAKDT